VASSLQLFQITCTLFITTKSIINDETLEQVSQFTYLGCGISYQLSNDVEFKLAKFLQLIGAIKRTIFKKVRTETILKIYNTLVLPTFLYLGTYIFIHRLGVRRTTHT